MTFLLRGTWLQAEAKKQGIKIKDDEAAKAFEKARKQAFPKDADYVKFLKTSGQTEADLEYRQFVQLLEQKITTKIQGSAEKVTDKDVKDYYAKNKEKQFTQPATRDLLVVLTQDAKKAQAAKESLDGGSSWVRVVQQYSTDPTTKQADGALPNVTQGVGNKDWADWGKFQSHDGSIYLSNVRSRDRRASAGCHVSIPRWFDLPQ